MTSIRHALGRRLVVGLFLVLALIGGGLYLLVRRLLTDRFDAALAEKARVLSGLMKQERGVFELELGEAPMPEFERAIEPEYFEVWLGDRVFQRSPSLGAGGLQPPASDALALADLRLPDGRPGRAAWLRFPVRIDDEGSPAAPAAAPARAALVVARGRGSLDEALLAVQEALALAGLLLLVGVPLVVTAAVRRGLRPLEGLTDQAARIDAGSLDRRFTRPGLPAELQPIASRLDDLLERLSGAFERERRFSADVAHELRTPIAELRALAEVALQFPDGADRRPFQDVLAAALQMEALVSALLTLSRCEAGRQPVARALVDVSRAVAEAWAPLAEQARGKALRVQSSAPEALASTDRVMLASILGNLLGNAVEYTPAGGALSWEVVRRDDAIAVTIANSNDGLTREDLAHVFEPFWRKDAARSDGRHGGLGLSLVAAFARLIGAEVRLELAGDQVRATLILRPSGPAARPAA